jgi:HK97 family phage portal protein
MGVLDRFRRQKKEVETKSVVLGTSHTLGNFLLLGEGGSSAATASSAKSLYNSASAIAAPINYVADPLADLEYGILMTDSRDLILDHPILDLLERPSQHYTKQLFFEAIGKEYLITGEYAVVALGNVDRPPLALQPIGTEHLSNVREQNTDAATSWILSGNTLTGTYVATPDVDALDLRYLDGGFRELKVVRNYSPSDHALGRGQSLLVAASKEARTAILGTQHNVSILENGGRVSISFHFEEDMDPEDFDLIKEKIFMQYGGAHRAGQLMVTAGGKLNVEELSKSPKDMDFAELQGVMERSLAKTYKVPLPLITDARQTLSNYEIAVLALYDDAVLPLATRVCGGLTDLLMPRFKMDPRRARIVPNPDSVTALVQRRNTELVKRKQAGIESDNELRALIGREPYEGGDVVLKPANMVPAGTDLFNEDNRETHLEKPATLGGAK